jgi:NADH-quinone oxidoreductase subunit M
MPGSFLPPLLMALPLLGAIFVLCTPKTEQRLHRGIGLVFMLLTFGASLGLIGFMYIKNPDTGGYTPAPGMRMVFDALWVPGLGARFKTGVDGLSLWLILLTTFLMPLTLFATGRGITKHVREFIAALLVLETGMLGVFMALDLVLFYVMWEVMLIPMYLIIGIWGGQRRLYASLKFFLYTMVGSLLMLVAIVKLGLYAGQGGPPVFGYDAILVAVQAGSVPGAFWLFGAFAVAFAVKVPMFPFHTWLPDAHVEAPTAGLGDPGGDHAQDGHVRLRAVRGAAVPVGRHAPHGADGDARARGDRHRLRRARGAGAAGLQEARRLLVGLAPRLRARSASSP